MRQFLTTSTFMLALVLWPFTAKADFLSVHADIPLSFSPTQEGADNPDSIAGARVGLSASRTHPEERSGARTQTFQNSPRAKS